MLDLGKLVKESLDKKSYLICEGGASGHMSHIFEDPDLTFNEIKKILTDVFKGKIQIEEKTDGQNLAVTWKDGKLGAARNKATLKEPMTIEQVAAKFEGRGPIRDAFVKSMMDVQKAVKALSDEEKKEIFNDGHNFMAFEIIYPPTKNVIDYGNRCIIQFHGVNIYDENWNKISEDKSIADKLYNFLKDKNALNQETFEITNHTKLKIKDMKSSEDSLKIILDKLGELVQGLGWGASISDYATERFEKYIINRAIKSDFPINKKSDFVTELANRLSNVSKRRPTKSDIAAFAKREGIDIKSDQYKNFLKELDDSLDEANQQVIKPLEDLVIQAGLLLMKNLDGYISLDPQKSAQRLSKELDDAINQLKNGDVVLDASKLARFKKNIAKIEQYQREVMPAEGIVFMYKGKVYKITSTFGSINQLMGLLKY